MYTSIRLNKVPAADMGDDDDRSFRKLSIRRDDDDQNFEGPEQRLVEYGEASSNNSSQGCPRTAWDILCRAAVDHADRIAYVSACDGSPVTYETMLDKAAAFAGFLSHSCGVGVGCRIAVLMRNSETVQVLHFAVARLGAVVVNINTSVTAAELVRQTEAARVSVLVASRAFQATVTNAFPQLGQSYHNHSNKAFRGLATIVWAEDHSARHENMPQGTDASFTATRSSQPTAFELVLHDATTLLHKTNIYSNSRETPNHNRFAQDEALNGDLDYQMYFTSGTTGLPKLIVLTHEAVCTHALGAAAEMRLHANDVWLHGYVPCRSPGYMGNPGHLKSVEPRSRVTI